MTAQIIKFPEYTRTGSRKRLQSPSGINRSLSEGTPREGAFPVIRNPHECPKIALLRRQSKMLREHFKREFSGGHK